MTLFAIFTEIAPVRTVDLTSKMVEDYLNWERVRRQPGYSGPYKKTSRFENGAGIENTVLHRAAVLKCILQDAKRDGFIEKNVASRRDSWVQLPKVQQHFFTVLTEDEAKKMMFALKEEPLWFRFAVSLGLVLGLRRSEIVGLCYEDFDFAKEELVITHTITQHTIDGKNVLSANVVTKNKRVKVFKISPALESIAKKLIEENKQHQVEFGRSYDRTWENHFFRFPDGRLISPNYLTTFFRKFLERHDLKKIRFHDLRHSCGSILYRSGETLKTIQETLGHSTDATARMYVHLYGNEKVKATNYLSELFLDEEAQSEGNENADGISDGKDNNL